MIKYLILIIATSLFSITASISYSKDRQIKVESDKLFVSQDPIKSIFSGDVYAYDSEIEIWSDKITITFYGPNNKIDTIEGEGKVKLIRDNQEINSDFVFYDLINLNC